MQSFIYCMYVDKQVWQWLKWIGYSTQILGEEVTDEEAIALSTTFTDNLFRGAEFKEILERLAIYYEIPFSKQQTLTSLTTGDSPSQRKYNWELIIDYLSSIGFRVDPAIAQSLQTPNEIVMRGFLGDLMEFLPIKEPEQEDENGEKLGEPESTLGLDAKSRKRPMGDKTFIDNFGDSKMGPTTMAGGMAHQQPIYRGN